MKRAASLEQDLFNYSIGDETGIKETGEKYKELMSKTMRDKNYSAAKEWICCFLANSSHNPAKHDYDGIIMTPAGPRHVEAKPHSVFQHGKKLNIKCAWADYTPQRLNNDRKHNPLIVSAGFFEHRLIYAISFDFNEPAVVAQIESDITKAQKKFSSRSVKIRRIIPQVNYGNTIKKIDMARVNLLYFAGVFDPQYKHCVGPSMRKWFQQLKESKELEDQQEPASGT